MGLARRKLTLQEMEAHHAARQRERADWAEFRDRKGAARRSVSVSPPGGSDAPGAGRAGQARCEDKAGKEALPDCILAGDDFRCRDGLSVVDIRIGKTDFRVPLDMSNPLGVPHYAIMPGELCVTMTYPRRKG